MILKHTLTLYPNFQANREKFKNNLISFMNEHDLDGIDLDWEYPGVSITYTQELVGRWGLHMMFRLPIFQRFPPTIPLAASTTTGFSLA